MSAVPHGRGAAAATASLSASTQHNARPDSSSGGTASSKPRAEANELAEAVRASRAGGMAAQIADGISILSATGWKTRSNCAAGNGCSPPELAFVGSAASVQPASSRIPPGSGKRPITRVSAPANSANIAGRERDSRIACAKSTGHFAPSPERRRRPTSQPARRPSTSEPIISVTTWTSSLRKLAERPKRASWKDSSPSSEVRSMYSTEAGEVRMEKSPSAIAQKRKREARPVDSSKRLR